MELKKWIRDLGITLHGQDVYFGTRLVYTLTDGENTIPSLWLVKVLDSTTGDVVFWEYVVDIELDVDKKMLYLGPVSLPILNTFKKNLRFSSTFHRSIENIEYILDWICVETKGKDWKLVPTEDKVITKFPEPGSYLEETPIIKIFK